MNTITTCLWFDTEAEAAVTFYTSVFDDSRLGKVTRYSNEGRDIHGKEAGSVMTVDFELRGQRFVALNGGPHFKFNEAVSFQVHCRTQKEIDYYWEKLGEGGSEGPCGWLKDKYGVSWQIVPNALIAMMSDPDVEKVKRATQAMFAMKKLDIAALERAYGG